MPRHRKECIPRHRAQSPGQQPGRRAPDSAASGGPENGSQTAAENVPAVEQNDTEPLLAVGSTPQPAAAGGPRRPQRQRLRRHAAATGVSRPRRMRGLLITPWFAAGAGFVIAAALALNSPHTVLTYRPNTEPCVGNCTSTGPSRGSAALATPGVQIKTASPARTGDGAHARRRSSTGAGPTGGHRGGGTGTSVGAGVGFRVLFNKYNQFSALITIPAGQTAHGWSLQFKIPGTQITRVWGAQWLPGRSRRRAGHHARPRGRPEQPGAGRARSRLAGLAGVAEPPRLVARARQRVPGRRAGPSGHARGLRAEPRRLPLRLTGRTAPAARTAGGHRLAA